MEAYNINQDNITDKLENYLISSAKKTLNNDLYAAKAWLLTAKVLYPHKFGVQFLAYQIEKTTNNLKDSAKCFAELLATFPTESDLCTEVQAMTAELRQFEEQQGPLENADYLVKLFYQLPKHVQRGLLLNCANNTQDPIEHSKLMLLLFRKFPSDIHTFGMEVMERLIAAEKLNNVSGSPLNSYRKVLVCELLPLLAQSGLDNQPNNLIRLLGKAVEFYLLYAFEGNKRSRREERDTLPVIDDAWARLWESIQSIGAKLNWELTSYFTKDWSRDGYFRILNDNFIHRHDEHSWRQLAFCTLIVLMRCIHEYLPSVEPANQDPGFVLVKAFVGSPVVQTGASNVPKAEDLSCPHVTAGHGASPLLVPAFKDAMKCYRTLHCNDFVRREYIELCVLWKADVWLHSFQQDAVIYNDLNDKPVMIRLARYSDPRIHETVAELKRLVWHYRVSDNHGIVDSLSKVAGHLSNIPASGIPSGNLLIAETERRTHLHFLPVTRPAILQYCVKVLLKILKKKTSDMALGHTLVLSQLNWPEDSDRLDKISDLITHRGGFTYTPFGTYIINIDFMERFTYLAGPNGPKLPLDLFVGTQIHSQRRMSTRGIDKGVKEDFKIAMRAQVSRWNEPVDELIIRFLKNERELIQHSIVPLDR